MTEENLKRLKERICNVMNYNKNEKDYKKWNEGYKAACRQILSMILEIERKEL